jgi:16S rRNA (cytidine1402-2'-O)-methyltransferase
VLPPGHEIALAREITKHHETIIKAPISDALDLVRTDDNMRKGEFVVIVAPAAAVDHDVAVTPEQEKILSILLTECSVKTASALAAEITGARKKTLYQAALAMANAADN